MSLAQDTFRDTNNNLVWVRPDGPYGTTPLQAEGDQSGWENVSEISEIEDYMIAHGHGISKGEKDALDEINEDILLDIAVVQALGGLAGRIYHGMDPSDMDNFEDKCNIREAYHALLASSPQGDGEYTYHSSLTGGLVVNYHTNQMGDSRVGKAFGDGEVDANNRIITNVEITQKGTKYIQGISKFGKVYIDKKFTRYIPEIGKEVSMVIGLKGCVAALPWNCYRVC